VTTTCFFVVERVLNKEREGKGKKEENKVRKILKRGTFLSNEFSLLSPPSQSSSNQVSF